MRFTLPIALLFVWISVAGVAGQKDADPGFTPIFDGVTLAGWDGDPNFWRVEDGAITGEPTGLAVVRAQAGLAVLLADWEGASCHAAHAARAPPKIPRLLVIVI